MTTTPGRPFSGAAPGHFPLELGTRAAMRGRSCCDVTSATVCLVTSFPLPGRHWVSGIGDYNEHLIRDVGSLYHALLAISVWTVVRPRNESFRLVGLAWLVFGVPLRSCWHARPESI